uniref:Uncharacterized protein n=1 Tax=Sphaerodactylus townsendi TaxID=933632 RepID=A0ACB8FZY9_9SAUR
MAGIFKGTRHSKMCFRGTVGSDCVVGHIRGPLIGVGRVRPKGLKYIPPHPHPIPPHLAKQRNTSGWDMLRGDGSVAPQPAGPGQESCQRSINQSLLQSQTPTR